MIYCVIYLNEKSIHGKSSEYVEVLKSIAVFPNGTQAIVKLKSFGSSIKLIVELVYLPPYFPFT